LVLGLMRAEHVEAPTGPAARLSHSLRESHIDPASHVLWSGFSLQGHA
jgi:hypothetical protein